MREYPCYRVVLSLASEYFDTMLSNSMRENETSKISFPDKDPNEWDNLAGQEKFAEVLSGMSDPLMLNNQETESDIVRTTAS